MRRTSSSPLGLEGNPQLAGHGLGRCSIRHHAVALPILLLALVGAACSNVAGGTPPLTAATPPEGGLPGTAVTTALVGPSWLLVSLDDQPPLAGTRVSAAFDADGRLSGSAGCNRYAGSYAVSGAQLQAKGPFATTRMFCDQAGVMEQERVYLEALQQVASYRLHGRQLTLADADGRGRLVFAAS